MPGVTRLIYSSDAPPIESNLQGMGEQLGAKRGRGRPKGSVGKHIRSTIHGTRLPRPSSASTNGSFSVGSTHWIRHRDGFPCLAEIIETRASPPSQNISDLRTKDKLQYYVHFCNFDKRLDEWVDEDRFLSTAQRDELRRQQSGELSIPAPTERTLSRELKKRYSTAQSSLHFADPKLEQLEREHQLVTKVKNIQTIQLGLYEIDCWYFSPYPNEYSSAHRLYICEKCLKYMQYAQTLFKHQVIIVLFYTS